MTESEGHQKIFLRIGIAEDHSLFRRVLAEALLKEGVEVVYAAESGVELIDQMSSDLPDAVILDIRMPPSFNTEGIKTARRLREICPGIPILFLSAFIEPSFLDAFEDDFASIGYLSKATVDTVSEVVEALKRVVDGEVVISGQLIGELIRSRELRSTSLDDLTEREIQVLRLISEGRSNYAIAREMHISEKSVEAYGARLYVKLGISAEPDANRRVLAVLAWLRSER